MAEIVIEGLAEFRAKMNEMSDAVRTRIAKDAVDEGAAVIQFHAQLNAMNVFSNHQRGQLRNSTRSESLRNSPKEDWIESRITDTGAEAEIGPHVIYGRIQELGGTIRPIKAKVLHFVIDNRDIFAKQVTLPPRPYLAPAVNDHIDEIRDVMAEAIADGLSEV